MILVFPIRMVRISPDSRIPMFIEISLMALKYRACLLQSLIIIAIVAIVAIVATVATGAGAANCTIPNASLRSNHTPA